MTCQPVVFDLEADGLNATKIHCLSANIPGQGIKTFYDYDNIKAFLRRGYTLVGHNITRYDIPTLERILGIKVKCNLVDTLVLSWYLEPGRILHGLDSWGEDLGFAKPKIDDWENLSKEEYKFRCESDVEINQRLWDRQLRQLTKLYEGEKKAWRLIRYLQFKMGCAALQEASRWRLDVDKCKEAIQSLTEKRNYKIENLREAMPRVPIKKKKFKPKKPYKQDGSLSKGGEMWFSLLKEQGLPKDHTGEVEYTDGSKEPNPASHVQIKDWLFGLGWKPQNYEYKRNKETNEIRKIPQIKSADGDGVCDSIKRLYHKEPQLELLDGLSILNHRIPLLQGFLDNADEEGYIQAQIHGITNTMRFKHKVVVNLPGIDKPYGDVIRGCLTAPSGYELCGSDMSSLEDRTKQHYMWEYDPEYVKQMLSDDFDPHLDLAVEANMLTEEDSRDYKNGKRVKELKPIRHDAKQVNYSCTYGVTPAGLVRNTGMSVEKAEKLHKTYWKRNWSIQKIADNCKVKTFNKTKWLFNPVSRFWYPLRTEKDRFSTLNQGTGVFCFDTWIYFVLSKRPELTGQMHDEIILTIKEGYRDRCSKLLNWAIGRANDVLKLNRKLEIDVEFGKTYADIH